jgi:tetratricopeptide (TPR) repeat protein
MTVSRIQDAERHLFDGRLPQAETLLREVLAAEPDNCGALYLLALVAKESGNTEAAVKMLTRVIELDSNHHDALNSLGILQASGNQLDAAVGNFRAAVTANPAFVSAHANLGATLFRQNKIQPAIDACRQALAIDPNHIGALTNICSLLIRAKDYRAAIDHHRQLAALQPDNPNVLLNLAAALAFGDRPAEAITVYQHVLDLEPVNTRALHGLGTTYSEMGDKERAGDALKSALAHDPTYVDAYYSLSDTDLSQLTESNLQQLDKLGRDAGTSPADKAKVFFVLAKAAMAEKDKTAAFDLYKQGNQHRREAQSAAGIVYSSTAQDRLVENLMAFFGKPADMSAPAGQGEKLIFVLGLPRSGTTLIEQILVAHPSVISLGENETIYRGILDAFGNDYLQQLDAARWPDAYQKELSQIAAAYLAETNHEGVKRTVNSLPFNFWHLGFIKTVFPDSSIIVTERDPRDVALSCYFQNFADDHPWSTTLTDLKHYFECYARLMAHWRNIYGKELHTIVYEDLVKNFDATCLSLLAHLSLEWDDRVLRFYETDNLVKSASKWQVRQPIYGSSVGRWRDFESQLTPFLT